MKPGAIFINNRRGAIMQEAALPDALNCENLRAARLDVFATEPLPMDSTLRLDSKITALAHMGSATFETRHAVVVRATTHRLQALAGGRPAAVFRMPAP